jgi:hypothetical protein
VSLPTDKLLEIVIEGLKNNKAKEIHILNLNLSTYRFLTERLTANTLRVPHLNRLLV